jgi:hypothetical protein
VRSPGDHKKGTHVGHHVLREARADEKRLLALPDAVALSLFRSGELHLISLHLASLANMKKLVDRMAARKMPLQPAPKPP